MKLSPDQVLTTCKGDPAIAAFVQTLLDTIEKQDAQIKKLEARVLELERQLGQNSRNSSKPPSSDGIRKPVNLRTKGGKKGAPKGHPGTTLHLVAQPDEVVVCKLTACPDCARSLANAPCKGIERRQEFDLPPPQVRITEYRAEKRYYSHCQRMQLAAFPSFIKAPTQYGKGFASWTAYLHAYHMLPTSRIADLFEDLTTYRPSEATLLSFLQTSYDALAPIETAIEKKLLQQVKVHADETGCRVEGKTQWMHVLSDEMYTLLHIHAKRGSPAIDVIGFLPQYQGTVVHDCMKGYFKEKYPYQHALCNAHLLRECIGIAEHDGHEWAGQMAELLQECWKQARASRQKENELEPEVIQSLCERYDAVLEAGKQEWMQDEVREKTCKKGRAIKSKAGNLGERLTLHKEAILSFLWRSCIPFDNNQAERDLRMVKVKQKVSGAFRTEAGAKIFARLRGVVSTLIKQKLPILSSLADAFRGTLILPGT